MPGKVNVLVEGSQRLALKSLPPTLDSIQEVRILRAVQGHPNIIKLIRTTVTATQVSLYMEYHPRTLLDLVSEFPDGVPLQRVVIIFRQIMLALAHIHKCRYVHHDLKLENILIDANDTVYVIDFGLSQPYTPGKCDSYRNFGSLHYAAPEVWFQERHEGPEVDVWAAGVCLFLLVTGFFPFGGTTPCEVWNSIRKRRLWRNDTLKKNMLLFDLLQRMLTFDWKKRITVSEIFQHPWLHYCERLGISLRQSRSFSYIDISSILPLPHHISTLRSSRSLLDDLPPHQSNTELYILTPENSQGISTKEKIPRKERRSKSSRHR